MTFVGLNREIFNIDEVESCEPKIKYVNGGRGQKIPMPEYCVILKTGERISVKLAIFNSIVELLSAK